MPLFQVLRQPARTAARHPGGDRILDDRFSWFAFWLPPIWALAHRLWVECVLILLAMIALGFLAPLIGGEAVFWLYVLLAVYLGFEASSLRAAALRRRGFLPEGELVAADAELAEMEWVRREVRM